MPQPKECMRSLEDVLIPCICFTPEVRRQFPLAPAYVTTFNSCQGLTLDRVAIDLTRPVFSHGQLYTALTRVRNRTHGLVRLRPGENSTTNVTCINPSYNCVCFIYFYCWSKAMAQILSI